MTLHYHGTPITPRSQLLTLAGRCFCVSYAEPRDVHVCHEIGQSVMLDNGAFTAWTQGRDVNWIDFLDWCEPWLDFPTTWAVVPDVIDGDEDINDGLCRTILGAGVGRDCQWAPVWHMHESLDRLADLAATSQRVCFGSSGAFAQVGSDGWRRRCDQAFDLLTRDGPVPWVHMLRGMALSGSEYPFASVDSTDVARNHSQRGSTAASQAARWDAIQCPARWVPKGEQLTIEETAA